MRITIRDQLGALVLFSTLVGLAVISVATWLTEHDFVLSVRASRLALTASLKAQQVSTTLQLMENAVTALSTRILLRTALRAYNTGDRAPDNWTNAIDDLASALIGLGGDPLMLQAVVFSHDGTVLDGGPGLIRVSYETYDQNIELPYVYPNGSNARLGDPGPGYPSNLYPNLTYSSGSSEERVVQLDGEELGPQSTVFLGPWTLNRSTILASITVPVLDRRNSVEILGWLTVLLNAESLYAVTQSPNGVSQGGSIYIVGPTALNNRFAGISGQPPFLDTNSSFGQRPVHYVFSPQLSNANPTLDDAPAPSAFPIASYPPVMACLTNNVTSYNHAGDQLETYNELGNEISVGYALAPTSLVTWVVLLEETRSEVWAPISRLRKVLLACVFITAGIMTILIWPVAHFSSLPIRRLRDATSTTVSSFEFKRSESSRSVIPTLGAFVGNEKTGSGPEDGETIKKFYQPPKPRFQWLRGRHELTRLNGDPERPKAAYKLPARVKDKAHLIEDELTDLTKTFNDMSDELVLYYGKLEERVRQRTAELEASKEAAEAANESKTLFIANVSHELRTPLNGILGICAVCLTEEDSDKIKHSLSIIYKSGELLHNLLTDLLTFSKNQMGQNINLDEKCFSIRDIETQLRAIFDNQAREGQIDFDISYAGTHNVLGAPDDGREATNGPPGTGRVKDMWLWGDQHRILQVVINLISNGLKFTPAEGKVHLKIKCLGEATSSAVCSRTNSVNSTFSDKRFPRARRSRATSTTLDLPQGSEPASALDINSSTEANQANLRRRRSLNASPERAISLPKNAKKLIFEFEVEDTGPGIQANLQSQIFEPFVQGDVRLTRKFGGTGLGLSICSQLAKLMKGEIDLQSEVGKGSTFVLRMPLSLVGVWRETMAPSISSQARSKANSISSETPATMPVEMPEDLQSPGRASIVEADTKPRLVGLSQPYFSTANPPMDSPSEEKSRAGRRVKVLVAEDNKVNQEVVLRMLKLEDVFDVQVARDGQEALDMVKESMELSRPYDLILMDVQMPNLDGRQSTRLIRGLGYEAPIVALTAFADETNQQECIESGMNYFLSKPIRRPQLKQVLRTYCSPIPEDEETSPSSTEPQTMLAGPATRNSS